MKKAVIKRTLILSLGTLTGLMVLLSTGLQYELSFSATVETENVEKSTEQPETTQLSTLDAVSNVISGHLILPVLLTFGEIHFEHLSQPDTKLDFSPCYRIFKRIFRRIIAPNAP